MATLRELRRRINTSKNISQITHTMELVAAAKMRRAQNAMEASRPYSDAIGNVLAQLAQRNLEVTHPFLQPREVKTRLLILVTTDRGLCGPLNALSLRAADRFIRGDGTPVRLVTVGRKGRDFFRRFSGSAARAGAPSVELVADHSGLPDRPSLQDVAPAATVAMEEFLKAEADDVWLLYARYVNALRQVPELLKLIPPEMPAAAPGGIGGGAPPHVEGGVAGGAPPHVESLYEFEPSPEEVLDRLLPRYVEVQVYHAVLENQASEQAAKMTAMRTATENAQELITDLTLESNKLRQQIITKELMEIVGGAEALAKKSA